MRRSRGALVVRAGSGGTRKRPVIIDRIPFPRPDNPLLNARQRAVEARGGNGFLSIAANHAGLLLAQGAGRLLRSTADKGVVAVVVPGYCGR